MFDLILLNLQDSISPALFDNVFFSCNGNTVVKIIKAGGSSTGMRKCITFYSIRVIEIGTAKMLMRSFCVVFAGVNGCLFWRVTSF